MLPTTPLGGGCQVTDGVANLLLPLLPLPLANRLLPRPLFHLLNVWAAPPCTG